MAVGEAVVCERITVLQLWLGISLFLSEWAQFGHFQYHSPPEVVTPFRVTGIQRGMSAPRWLSYSLYFGGQRHIVHMKTKKFLVSRHFSVFTYTDQGALLEDHPFGQNDCYYDGYVDRDPESLVALSTCFGGFQGMLAINDTVYEIKLKMFSATFEHLVYKIDSEELQFPPLRCGLTEEEIAQQLKLQRSNTSILKQSSYEGWWTHRLFLETVLVVDYERYLYKESNVSLVTQEVLLIVNTVHSLLNTLGIDLVLLALEIWNEGNPMAVGDINTLLKAFCEWKIQSLNPRINHDLVHLFVKNDFGIYLGLAHLGMACHSMYNCGVDRLMGDKIFQFQIIVTHEMGHNLGMDHDEKTCTCGQPECIMFPHDSHATKFSNCSYASYWNERFTCMYNIPIQQAFLDKNRCGNSVVEEGEQCDCGTLCDKDPCCSETCQLRSGAACASGLCCKNCQIMPSGTVCREEDNECDLPEWCNGASPECPEDVYVQDGLPCMDGAGYCHEKRCNARDEQCRQIFGKDSHSAVENCYMDLNTRGDRFGNCGLGYRKYIKCHVSNSLCGRVYCQNVTKIPQLIDHSTMRSISSGGVSCWSTDYHFGMTIPDIGAVKDGTKCGVKHVCIRRKCVTMSYWDSDCTSLTCNMQGICNNKHHCHCDSNWKPPNCTKEGNGGSVDSGPPPVSPVNKTGPTTVTPENETGPTPRTPATHATPVRPVSRTAAEKYASFLFPLLLLLLLSVLLLWSKPQTSVKKEQAGPEREQEMAEPGPETAP